MCNALKRPYDPSALHDGDSENVDPMLMPLSKKSKSGLEDIILSKSSQFAVTTMRDTPARPIRPLPASRQAAKPTPASFTSKPPPASAGRLPTKLKGVMSKRRKTTRINPPNFSIGSVQGSSLPFSLDTALSGTVSSYKTTASAKHMFVIHEDTEDQEMENLFNHSTQTLDISDDESRAGGRDDRGKENIPPVDAMYAAAPTNNVIPTSRKNLMTDEPRTPLGPLNPAEFYAQGYDENSFTFVPAEEEEEQLLENVNYATEFKNDAGPKSTVEPVNYWKDLLADLEASKKYAPGGSVPPINEEVSNEAPFDIWESESSKGEEAAQHDAQSPTPAVASDAEKLLTN